MSRFGNFIQGMAERVPGNSWASSSRLGDVLTGGVARAANRNEWRFPGFGSDQTSIDDLAAVGTGNSSLYRSLARGAGAGFGAWGLGTLLGGSASGAESGGGEAAAAPESSSPSWQDYLRRYGRQGMNLMSNMGGAGGIGGGNVGGLAAVDNSLIAPIPVHDQFADQTGGVPPGLLAMLLAQQRGAPDESQDNQQPYISARGLV